MFVRRVRHLHTQCSPRHHLQVPIAPSHGRHTATAGAKRPTVYLTSSTLLYSGIFAVAASTDAIFKEKRRKDWDHAIDALRTETSKGDNARGERTYMSESESTQSLDDVEALFSKLPSRQLLAQMPVNSGKRVIVADLPPQSIYACPNRREYAASAPWSARKLRLSELAADYMILHILLYLDDQQWRFRNGYRKAVPREFLKVTSLGRSELELMLKDVKSKARLLAQAKPNMVDWVLLKTQPVIVAYTQDGTADILLQSDQLAHELSDLFAQHSNRLLSTDWLLLQICHNLATSTAPPHLSCYNTLLEGFVKERGCAPLVRHTISSMRCSNVRMNETSLVLHLDHFRKTNNRVGFDDFLARMRGERGGLMLALPENKSGPAQSDRFATHHSSPGKLVEKPYPVTGVMTAVTRCMLHFHGFSPTLDLCKTMGIEGWGLSVHGLVHLLDDCSARSDWINGTNIWQHILQVQKQSCVRNPNSRLPVKVYASMLKLCKRCEAQDEFEHIIKEASLADTDRRELEGLVQAPRALPIRRTSFTAKPIAGCKSLWFGKSRSGRLVSA